MKNAQAASGASNDDLALALHKAYRGKIQTVAKCPMSSHAGLAIWYTPGVAAPSRAISGTPALVYDYTNKGNTVAIVTDGSRVLGLGNIGPLAAMPVMEGKALLFKHFGAVDAVPICLDTHDPAAIISVVKAIAPSFGGINLEDVTVSESAPRFGAFARAGGDIVCGVRRESTTVWTAATARVSGADGMSGSISALAWSGGASGRAKTGCASCRNR